MTHAPGTTLRERTIADFGEQWTRFRDNSGYYASSDLLDDIFAGLLRARDVQGARVADIGSGTGRIVGMLAAAGAEHITAVEPSKAFAVLEENTRQLGHRVRALNVRGDELPGTSEYDLIVSIGVLHHVPQPEPIVRRAYEALRPGGRLVVWLYGHEGNEMYLRIVKPLRRVTSVLPDDGLVALAWCLEWPLRGYIRLCRHRRLPMADYMTGHLSHLDAALRRLTIYDQLNPAYARYYRRNEAVALLANGGFQDVKVSHRHGYSWTVSGVKR